MNGSFVIKLFIYLLKQGEDENEHFKWSFFLYFSQRFFIPKIFFSQTNMIYHIFSIIISFHFLFILLLYLLRTMRDFSEKCATFTKKKTKINPHERVFQSKISFWNCRIYFMLREIRFTKRNFFTSGFYFWTSGKKKRKKEKEIPSVHFINLFRAIQPWLFCSNYIHM